MDEEIEYRFNTGEGVLNGTKNQARHLIEILKGGKGCLRLR